MNKKVYDFIKGHLLDAVVILTSFAYVFYNMVVIEKTGLTIAEVIAKAGIGVIIGFIIKVSLGENGFNYGYRSQIWMNELEKYSECCNIANPYIERVDNFYHCEEIEKRKNYRRTNLMNARIRYDWFFNEKGEYIENKERYEKLDKKQRKILRKCINVKIYNLNLFSEYSNEVSADTKREKTDKDQRSRMFGKNSFMTIFSSVIGAYFVTTWNNWDWGTFITATIQVCIWISCGITQLYTNYNYVVIEKTNKLKRKKELIVKFKRGCEEGKYLTNPYEEVISDEN